MNDIFEMWCQDSRSLTYGEFLDELYGEWKTWCRDVAPGFLDDRWKQGAEPQTPIEKTYHAVYEQCRRRMRMGQWFAVCFLDVDRYQEYTQRFGGTAEQVIEILDRIVDQIVLEPGLDGFVARVGKLRFILILPASRIADVCTEILACFDKHFSTPAEAAFRRHEDKALSDASSPRVSIGVVTNQYRHFEHFSQIAELAIEMLAYAKTQQGSVFVVDRRTEAEGKDPVSGAPEK